MGKHEADIVRSIGKEDVDVLKFVCFFEIFKYKNHTSLICI